MSYQWYQGSKGNTSLPVGTNSATFTTPLLTQTTSYWVRVTNAGGSVDSNAVTVTVQTPPPPSITTQPASTTIAYAGAATLQVTATGAGILSYQWYQGSKGDTSTPIGVNSTTLTTPELTQTTSYWVRITNVVGNIDSSLATVIVLNFSASSLNVGNQISVNFASLSSSGTTFKLSGKLPPGLKFNAKTGLLDGILTKAGAYMATLQVLSGKTVVSTVPLNFQVGAFPASLAGTYEAILEDVQGLPVGSLLVTVGTNIWSASLREKGQKPAAAKGTFILDAGSPTATLNIAFKGKPTISLRMDGNEPIVSAAMGAMTLRGFKLASGAENPPSSIGMAMVLDAGEADGMGFPAGFGWAAGSLIKTGKGSFIGMLPDGTKLTASVSLSTTGQAVLWAQPYKNGGSYLGGVISLTGAGQPAHAHRAIEGNCVWVLQPGERGNPYAFAEGVTVDVACVPMKIPSVGSSLTASIWGSPKNASGEALSWPASYAVDSKFNLTAGVAPIKWKGKINAKNGTFSGSYTIPAGSSPDVAGTAASVSGVFVQEAESGKSKGYGLIRIPAVPKGAFRTSGILVEEL